MEKCVQSMFQTRTLPVPVDCVQQRIVEQIPTEFLEANAPREGAAIVPQERAQQLGLQVNLWTFLIIPQSLLFNVFPGGMLNKWWYSRSSSVR